jgi:hypothetical protein
VNKTVAVVARGAFVVELDLSKSVDILANAPRRRGKTLVAHAACTALLAWLLVARPGALAAQDSQAAFK